MVEQNLEKTLRIRGDEGGLRPGALEGLNEAWSRGEYKIYFMFSCDHYGEITIEISARRYGNNTGVEITKQWREVREQLAKGEIPDWLVEKALKNN